MKLSLKYLFNKIKTFLCWISNFNQKNLEKKIIFILRLTQFNIINYFYGNYLIS